MTEELTVDGSLRNASTVDGEILLPSAWRIVVNDLRNDFLSHAAFSDDEHRKISRCHLQGDIESSVQFVAVAYDIVPQFDLLKFRCIHLAAKITHFF